jgi:signal transduction histidine kinase
MDHTIDFNTPEMLKFFLEKTEDVMVILSEEGDVIFMSETVEIVLEWTVKESLGKKINELWIGFPAFPLLESSLKIIIPITTKSTKRNVILEFSFQAMTFQDVPGNFIFCVGKEVTERELALKKFKDIALKEKELSQLKSRFVSMASHEFKTPIATIVSSVMIMQMHLEKEFSEEIRKKLLGHTDKIINQSNRLTSILSDVLLLEKTIQPDLELNLKKLSVRRFLTQVIEELNEENMNKREIRLFLPKEDRFLFTDEALLVPVIRNLIQNALNYSPNSKDPEVHVIFKDDQVEIMVKDFGIGIPKDEHETIFKSFYRGKNVGNIKGTGLGLNIVQTLTNKLNGEIWFKSKEGRGSEFFVSFPVQILNS